MTSKKTPVFDYETGDFKYDSQGNVLTVSDALALEQIVLKIHTTPRGFFLIYADPENADNNHKYGSDVAEIMLRKDIAADVRDSEIERAIREALIYDPWVIDVQDIKIYQEAVDGVTVTYADYTLVSVFDNETEVKGVPVYG